VTAGPPRRDLALHAEVCARPAPAWNARCACAQLAVRHADLSHASIGAGVGRVCTGRNLAGPCRDCPCPAFTPTLTAA